MATTYLSRNFTSGDRQTFTISAWVKRSSVANPSQSVISAGSGGDKNYLHFENGALSFERYNAGFVFQLITNRVFRDTSAWYHIVVAYDSTQATASNRIKMYINGVQETSFATANYPTLDYNSVFNTSGYTNFISKESDNNNYFDGLMAHVNFIDGLAYDASTFGETNAASGIWTPIASPSVTYGNNGYFLKFGSSGALGTDSSGNSNTFTVNGSGTQTQDAPSNVFCTGNPLYRWNYNSTQTNGNTSFAGTQNQWQGASSTLGISKGKWYFEAKITNDNGLSNGSTAMMIGFMGLDDYILSNPSRNLVGLYSYDGGEIFVADTSNNFATTADYGTFATNDIMGVALDYDNELISYYKNGSAIATNFDYGATPYSSTLKDGKTITPVFVSYGTNAVSANFGNGYFGTTAVASGNADGAGYGIFEYAPPTGYYSLCTKNINTYG
jgi:hypothetical protein